MKIITEKQPNRTDPFFYYDPIAQATAKDGTEFISEPSGEVELTIGDTEYNNDRRFGEGDFDNLTDDDLDDENGNVVWRYNNWFNIVVVKTNGELFSMETVDYDYDSAISALEDIVEQYDKGELKLR